MRVFSFTIVAAGLAAFALDVQAGTVDTAECRRDLIVMDSELSTAQAKLVKAQDSSRQEQCAVWREQITTFKKASALYKRCKTDTDRRVMSGQMDSQVNDFQSALTQMCKGR
ncbi:hypothetical protein [uncultured Alsobacter sp.]|uniref:hypothetical protein n=1 Tax=uncultured Alsobacter sp. TaxID=1748258 RepID=UPI0025D3B515|nr:hypothetical protein [uncultured Alsobacter sp.]